MGYLADVVRARELLVSLTQREIRGKYRRTVLGQLWSLVNPIALMLVYTFIFGVIFQITPDPGDPSGLHSFPLWLLCGLLPWMFFANGPGAGAGSIITNAGLVQKVYFPRAVLPLSVVAASSWNWAFEMTVLIVALSIAGAFVLPWVPLVILAMVLMLIFTAGVALLLSIATVHFRDTQHFLALILQIWMYLSPIIYPMSLVRSESERVGPLAGTPVTIEGIYALNPMVHFIELFRNLLYDNRWPDPMTWAVCSLWAFGLLLLGALVFRRAEHDLAEAL